ncbi:hypothetical protein BGX23_000739 [Mortierella sp. AD031]|nr:hypothetical protein BGX23_000739 [Mortierella sp. AD031]
MPWSVLEPRIQALGLLPAPVDNRSSIRILNLGCGNSDLPLDLYRSGYHFVTSVDFVGSVVERMKERCERAIGWSSSSSSVSLESVVPTSQEGPVSSTTTPPLVGTTNQEAPATKNENESSPVTTTPPPQSTPQQSCPLQFLEMDCLDMSALPEQSFEVCFDKSTSDAISCGDDDECTKLRTLCEQVARVVRRPGGVWCVISYSRFRQYEWDEGLGCGLWKTERIEEIKIDGGGGSTTNRRPSDEAANSNPVHTVHVPEVFQYLYVNRRL